MMDNLHGGGSDPGAPPAGSGGAVAVLNVIYSFKQGGAETVMLGLAQAFSEPGSRWRPVVVAWRRAGPLEDAFRKSGASVHVLDHAVRTLRSGPMLALDAFALLRRLRRIALGVNARLLHGHMSDGAFLAAVVARLLGRPCVTSVYSNHILPVSLGERGVRAWLWRVLAGWTFRTSARVIVLSEEMRDTLVSRFDTPVEKVRICPPGVAAVTPAPGRAEARRRLGVGEDALVLLFVARLVANKNQTRLIETTRILAERGANPVLLLCGDGPDRAALAAVVDRLGLGHCVRLLGRHPDLPLLFAAADMFVSASHTEGVSLAILEAMSASVPVVAVANEGNRDTLRDGCGLLVPADDPAGLADAIAATQADEGLRRRLTTAARARFEKGYGVAPSAAAVASVYAEILGPGGARP